MWCFWSACGLVDTGLGLCLLLVGILAVGGAAESVRARVATWLVRLAPALHVLGLLEAVASLLTLLA